jgi:hypothetical protein
MGIGQAVSVLAKLLSKVVECRAGTAAAASMNKISIVGICLSTSSAGALIMCRCC